MTEKDERPTRSIETTIEIDAPVDAVWKAIADAEELTRWFPMEARVTPGEGGSIWMSWGEGDFQEEARIDGWSPNERLRTVFRMPDFVTGKPIETVVEYRLASRGGATRLRLVHSGFGEDESWDDLYDGTVRGWAFELRGLKLYLERHRGTPRRVVRGRRRYRLDVPEAWARLTSRGGLLAEGSLDGLGDGDHFALRTANGLALYGTILIHDPPVQLAAVVESLGAAYLRLKNEVCWPEPELNETNLWLSLYGRPEAEAARLHDAVDGLLAGCFPEGR